jgi:hypothetical protein
MRRKTSPAIPTQHALLVVWGEYANHLGVTDQLMKVPLQQKVQIHCGQRKVLELLVATLAGLPHLQDISRSSHPLDQDLAVAQAWGQTSWADYSGVSRTLQSLSMANVNSVMQALQSITQPFIDQEIALALQQEGRVIFDGDLTGLAVSKSSTTYPEVSYGHMDDMVRLGYQAALVSLRSPTYGRLWLSIAHHPGNTLSSQQAIALVQAAEASTGRRPWRRVDLLEQRLQGLEPDLPPLQKRLQEHQQRLQTTKADWATTQQQRDDLERGLAELEQAYQDQNRNERPHSQLHHLRQRVQTYQNRCVRRAETIEQAKRAYERSLKRVEELQARLGQLRDRLEQFRQDNLANPDPLQAVFRLDAGFGTWENIAWLIEMGYEVYTKVFSGLFVQRLHRALAQPDAWQPVGTCATLQVHPRYVPDQFPYPVDIGLLRFDVGKEQPKPSILLHYGPVQGAQDRQAWFDFYNRRQTIEAGIKESKAVFYLHHFKVRSLPAMILQDLFVIFAANFIRWASVWMELNCAGSAVDDLDHRKVGTKRLVHVMAHTSGEVSHIAGIGLLRFSPLSCLANKELRYPCHSTQPEIHTQKVPIFRLFQRFLL